MVTVPRPPPIAEVALKYERSGMVWRGLVPDPEAHMERVHAEPLRYEDSKGPKLYKGELWLKWKDENGIRPEERDSLDVWRDPVTKRFAKAPHRAQQRRRKE